MAQVYPDTSKPRVHREIPRVALVGLGLAAWLSVVLVLWPAHGALLGWDEVDYVNAARLGACANALERGSLAPGEFIRFSLAKGSGATPSLPAGYEESRDPLLLRHYHPPFVVYLLSAVVPADGIPNERLVRSVQLLGALALIGALLFGYWWASVVPRWPGALAVAVMAFWMSRLLFHSLSFHGWAAVWSTATAALLSRWLNSSSRAEGILLCAALALGLLTLETGLLIWVIVLLCLAVWRPRAASGTRRPFPWRGTVGAGVLATLLVVVAWPGSVTKISLVKLPALYLYRILSVGEEYARVSGRLPALLATLLPSLLLVLLAYLWLLRVDRAGVRRWGPFVVMGAIYGAVLARFTLGPQYLLPALAPLACLVGAAVDRVPSRTGRWAAAVLVALLVLGSWSAWPLDPRDRETRADLRWLAHLLRGREVLADGGHIYEYYLGSAYAIRPITVAYDGQALLLREGGAYRPLVPEQLEGKVVVIQAHRKEFFAGGVERALLAGCSRRDRATVRVYDCSGRKAPADRVTR